MRICFFTDTFFPVMGGAEMVLHHLVSELQKYALEPVVLAPQARGSHPAQEYPYPVYRYAKPVSKRWGVRQTLIYLSALHLRYKFQLLHCHAAYPQAYVGRSFKKIFQIPMVVRPHGSDIVPGGHIRRHSRLEKRIRKSLNAADAVVAQGEYLKEVILKLGLAENHVQIIHNGVDLASFANGKRYDHRRSYILGLGNLIYRKGFDILLRAYARLETKNWDLIIAGEGKERLALEQQSAKLGIADRVFFPGFVKGQEKINLYRGAEFFICPSRSEPFANVILEAMAAELPVVASDADGNKELIRHEKQGLLFPRENEQALCRMLQRLATERSLIAHLRSSARKYIRQFDWPVIARHYLELYRKCCSSSRYSGQESGGKDIEDGML